MPVTQLNTDGGFGGECHLDANMVRTALPDVPLDEIDLLIIENVGNLVCPAEFRVGEDAKAMVCSVTEGEDKPLKYPLMFRTCELVVVNKIDLLPHLDYDLDELRANIALGEPGRGGHRGAAPAPARAWTRFRDWLLQRGRTTRSAREHVARVRAAFAEAGRARSARAVPPRWPSGSQRGGRLLATGVAAGALGRPPRGRGVRAPGDRGQARAAGAGADRRGRRPRAPGRADRRARATCSSPSTPPAWSWRASAAA